LAFNEQENFLRVCFVGGEFVFHNNSKSWRDGNSFQGRDDFLFRRRIGFFDEE